MFNASNIRLNITDIKAIQNQCVVSHNPLLKSFLTEKIETKVKFPICLPQEISFTNKGINTVPKRVVSRQPLI